MAIFQAGVSIKTAEDLIEVEVTPDRPLSVGRHVFQLEVVDDAGNLSAPDRVVVIVRDEENPTAVLDAPSTAPFGKPFRMSGKRSSDPVPGKVVQFIWTLVE